ncbi:MAG: hypothetical protein ACRD1V_19430 [Vicinamibacterales bacterium]
MSWMRFAVVVVGSGVVVSLIDWLTAGDWLHRRWTYAEVWRSDEGRAIALTSPLPFATAAAFAYLAARLGLHSAVSVVKLAAAIWIIGPLPLILTNAAFMKLHRVFVTSYALGWLVKLVIIALVVAWVGLSSS